uniref:Uncharacterized protein n=1 Tax=Panagrolaimus sp. ES5 TaxID=591445 RepID=A0AC34GX23_9BILA
MPEADSPVLNNPPISLSPEEGAPPLESKEETSETNTPEISKPAVVPPVTVLPTPPVSKTIHVPKAIEVAKTPQQTPNASIELAKPVQVTPEVAKTPQQTPNASKELAKPVQEGVVSASIPKTSVVSKTQEKVPEAVKTQEKVPEAVKTPEKVPEVSKEPLEPVPTPPQVAKSPQKVSEVAKPITPTVQKTPEVASQTKPISPILGIPPARQATPEKETPQIHIPRPTILSNIPPQDQISPILVEMSEHLSYSLGYKDKILLNVPAQYSPDLKGIRQFGVYADGLVESSVLGDIVAPLLRVVNTSNSNPGENNEIIYDTPIFSRVVPKNITEIDISLRTLDGNLLPMDYGTVIVTLQFKKEKSI